MNLHARKLVNRALRTHAKMLQETSRGDGYDNVEYDKKLVRNAREAKAELLAYIDELLQGDL